MVDFVILLGIAAWLPIWLWAIFDVNGYPDEAWREAGKDKVT